MSEWISFHSKAPAFQPGLFHFIPSFLHFPAKLCFAGIFFAPGGCLPGFFSPLHSARRDAVLTTNRAVFPFVRPIADRASSPTGSSSIFLSSRILS